MVHARRWSDHDNLRPVHDRLPDRHDVLGTAPGFGRFLRDQLTLGWHVGSRDGLRYFYKEGGGVHGAHLPALPAATIA